jgi:hypothetical protein
MDHFEEVPERAKLLLRELPGYRELDQRQLLTQIQKTLLVGCKSKEQVRTI